MSAARLAPCVSPTRSLSILWGFWAPHSDGGARMSVAQSLQVDWSSIRCY